MKSVLIISSFLTIMSNALFSAAAGSEFLPVCATEKLFRILITCEKAPEVQEVKELIEGGADVHARYDTASRLHDELVLFFNSNPANAYRAYKLRNGNRPLHYAAQIHEGDKIVELLVDSGSTVNAVNAWGRTSLQYSIMSFQFDTMSLLLAQSADPNSADQTGETPLFDVVRKNTWGFQSEALQNLLTQWVDIDMHNSNGKTVAGIARKAKSYDVLALIQKEKARRESIINTVNKSLDSRNSNKRLNKFLGQVAGFKISEEEIQLIIDDVKQKNIFEQDVRGAVQAIIKRNTPEDKERYK